jgi:hypothetical protein
MRVFSLVLSLVWILLGSPAIVGQSLTGSVVGRVIDPAGLPIAGANVSVHSRSTNREYRAATDQGGYYSVTGVAPDIYELRIEHAGFLSLVDPRIDVNVSQEVRADAKLEIGSMQETVVVHASREVLDTENGERGETIHEREMRDLPLNGRNYLSLALLSPAVVPAAAGQNPHNVNGSRPDHVAYLLEGTPNSRSRDHEQVVSPSLEAVQQFKLLTDAYAPEYGRMEGVLSVALRSGANQFHGAVFEFLRNDALDARGFFDRQTPSLKRNQFGALLGGPIRKDSTFFLASYEGVRDRQQQTRLSRVPSLSERAGQFAAPLRDPLTRKPFADNRIPAGRIDPAAAALLAFVPEPNRDGAFNFDTAETLSAENDVLTLKFDHRFGARDSLSARAIWGGRDGADPFRSTTLPGFGSESRREGQQWGITYMRIFSPSLLNEFRAGFGRVTFEETSVNAGLSLAAEAGIGGVASGSGLSNINIAGFSSFGDSVALPSDWTTNSFPLADTLTWTKGRHVLKFGANYERSQYFELFGAFTMGQFSFINGFTGNALGDFLLGLPAQAQRQVGTNKAYLLSGTFGAFAQDSWQVTPRLTLTYGLRYDRIEPPVEKHNRWANFIPELGRSIYPGEPGYPRSLMRTENLNFSPRVGFAWRFGDESLTVVRGGYGVFYGNDFQFQVYQALGATAYPFTRLELIQATAAAPLALADAFAADSALDLGSLSPNGWSYDNQSPYTQNWNLTVGRQITASMSVEAAYVGAVSTHQSAALNANQWIRTPEGVTKPYPALGRVLVFEPGASAAYHALQSVVRRTFSNGLSLRGAFTWSKAIDAVSFGSAARQPQNSRDLRAERGRADFDRRAVWSSDVIYDLPFGRGRAFSTLPNWLNAAVGDWRVSVIAQAYSGAPFTPTQTGNSQQGAPTRPDRVGEGIVAEPSVERWFDPSAFSVVPLDAFRYGNSGRNILTGPGYLNFDASVEKEFAMGEGRALQLRGEFFNALNRANFGPPATAVDQPTAGGISSAAPARQVQLGLKFLF